MGNLGFWEIMIVLLVVLVLFGAKRLPEMGSSLGKGIREFKRSITGIADEVNNLPEERPGTGNPSDRQIDSAAPAKTSSSTSGEPKRLSQ